MTINFIALSCTNPLDGQVEFDAEHFPEDFNDSAYTFVKRYDKVVRKGNAEPAIKDFVIMTPSGVDTTVAILSDPREMLVLFIRKPSDNPGDWISSFQEIVAFAKNMLTTERQMNLIPE